MNQSPGPSLLTIVILFALAWLILQQLDKSPVNPDDPDPSPGPAVDGEVWHCVAYLVENGDPEDSQELCALVIQLKEVNLLTQAQVDDFNNAFPGISETDRDLTDADAEKLRGLE